MYICSAGALAPAGPLSPTSRRSPCAAWAARPTSRPHNCNV